MLQFAGAANGDALRLLILHDDEQREFAYVAGAEKSLELARKQNWPSLQYGPPTHANCFFGSTRAELSPLDLITDAPCNFRLIPTV
jgi:hypothetical protein